MESEKSQIKRIHNGCTNYLICYKVSKVFDVGVWVTQLLQTSLLPRSWYDKLRCVGLCTRVDTFCCIFNFMAWHKMLTQKCDVAISSFLNWNFFKEKWDSRYDVENCQIKYNNG